MLNTLLNTLSSWLTGLVDKLMGLSTFSQALLVALIAFLFLAIQTLRSRKNLRLPPLKSEKKSTRYFKLGSIKVFAWLVQFFQDVRTLFSQSEDLYKTPWILLIGEEKSGTSSLAESLKNSNKFNSLLSTHPKIRQEQGWWPFDTGMLIDLQGLISRSSRKEVVDEFMRLRPERPFDGVVVCISAEQLAHGTAQQLSNRGIAIHEQLSRLQQEFAFTFPVYIVITKTDMVPGFSEFWRAQDKEAFQERLREIFGWSNPNSLEAGYSGQWLEDAFDSMQASLRVEQLRVSAEGTETHEKELDNFFLFPAKLQQLRAPIKKLFERVFTVNAYQANFFLRGIYFSGKVIDDSEGAIGEDIHETPVSFIETLFSTKVFAERHLARPIREGIWSRQQQIKRLQKMILGAAVFFCLALILSSFALKSKVDSIEIMLNLVSFENDNSNLTEGQSCTEFSVVSDTLGSLGSLSSDIGSAFIPLSWFASSLEGSIFGFLSDEVMEDLVVDAMLCQIEKREQQLVSSSIDLHFPEPGIDELSRLTDEVEDYLRQVIEYERILDIWSNFAGSGQGRTKYEQLGELFFALYGEPIPSAVHRNRSVIVDVLDYSTIKGYRASDIVSIQIVKNVNARLTDLDNLTTQVLQSGVDVVNQYNKNLAISGKQVTLLANWVDWVDDFWLPRTGVNVITECEKISVQLGAELKAIEKGANLVLANQHSTDDLSIDQSKWSSCRARAQQTLASVTMAPISNMLVYEGTESTVLSTASAVISSVTNSVSSDSVVSGEVSAISSPENNQDVQVVSHKWTDEADRLSELSNYGFMSAPSDQVFDCKADAVRWDNTLLQQMLQRMAELSAFSSADTSTGLGDGKDYPHEKIAKWRLAEVLNRLANSAQLDTYSSAVYSSRTAATPTLAELRQGSEDFVQSSASLEKILQQYIDLGMSDEGAGMAVCAQNFATKQLNALTVLADSSAVLKPTENTQAKTDTSAPLLLFGGANSPDNWWPLALETAKSVVDYSTPYVSFLQSSQQTYGLTGNQTAVWYYWNNSIAETVEFDSGSTTGQVSALKELFSAVADLNAENCASKITTVPRSTLGLDLYSARRQQYTDLVDGFCQQEVQDTGSTVYSQLQSGFNAIDSGFPFTASTSVSEANLAEVRDFFLDYGSETDVLNNYLKADQGSVNSASNNLLVNQFNGGVQFFNSHLAVEGSPAALDLAVTFRPDQTNTVSTTDGSRDVVLWVLTNGIDTVKRPQGQTSLSWFYGQPLIFSFSWADDGDVIPQTDVSQPRLTVDTETRTATYNFGGTWAFQRMIAEHWYSGPATGTLAPKTVRLKFDIPVVSTTDLSSRSPSSASASSTVVSLYVDLDVTTISSNGQTVPVFVPQNLPRTFPKIAP